MGLKTTQKAGWGLADLGINIFVVVKQLLVFTYLTTYLGVPAAAAGWVGTRAGTSRRCISRSEDFAQAMVFRRACIRDNTRLLLGL